MSGSINGKEYKSAMVSSVEADGITIKFSGGNFTATVRKAQQRHYSFEPIDGIESARADIDAPKLKSPPGIYPLAVD